MKTLLVRTLAVLTRNNMSTTTTNGSNRVAVEESRRFMYDCFRASPRTPELHARAMADLLVEADYRGHFSHGMNRLEMYINDLHTGSTDGAAEPLVLHETAGTAWVDGRNGLGAVVGNFCMELAMQKARNVGVGVVSAKGSNHYGIAGWYSMLAQRQGFIGISMTNTSPLVTPTRSRNAALGTNPISFAAPANGGDSFVLDMATSAVALGKIEIQKRKGEPLPNGWAQDVNGQMTTDATVAYAATRLMPLGGAEITSGYKGYGLAAMVETLCGLLAGAAFASNVRNWTVEGSNESANLGQFFMVLDPGCFAPGFTDRMSEQNELLRNLPRVNEDEAVLVAGDPERSNMASVDQHGGIAYHQNQIDGCNRLATRLGIAPLSFI